MTTKIVLRAAAAIAALGPFALPAHAAGVDSVLGEITGTPVLFSGTTLGADNDIDTYAPNGSAAAFWDQDYIYQFTVSSAGTLTLESDDLDTNSSPDNDFFVLSSLATTVNGNGFRQATTLPTVSGFVATTGGSWYLPSAGTYYLAIDAWRGSIFGEFPDSGFAGAFNGSLTFEAVPEPGAAVLAVLGLAGLAVRRRRRVE